MATRLNEMMFSNTISFPKEVRLRKNQTKIIEDWIRMVEHITWVKDLDGTLRSGGGVKEYWEKVKGDAIQTEPNP